MGNLRVGYAKSTFISLLIIAIIIIIIIIVIIINIVIIVIIIIIIMSNLLCCRAATPDYRVFSSGPDDNKMPLSSLSLLSPVYSLSSLPLVSS